MATDERFSSLIGLIYEAAIDETRWDAALLAMRVAFAASAALFCRRAPASGRAALLVGSGLPDEPTGLSGGVHDALRRAEAQMRAGVVEEFEAILPLGEPILAHLPSAWRARQDLPHGLAVAVLREPDHAATLEMLREEGSAPFDEAAFDLARLLVPHLARAVVIERGIALDHMRSAAATAISERLSIGAILVDPRAGVLDCSRRASEILEQADGLRLEEGRLAASLLSESSMLRKCIQETASQPGESSMRLLLTRRSQKAPLAVEITRLSTSRAEGWQDVQQLLVYVRDPDRAPEVSTGTLRRLYGLTPTEAEVTALVARGMNHREAARELGVTVCAVRFHLKNIYAKTCTQRQAELVYLLATGPAQLVV